MSSEERIKLRSATYHLQAFDEQIRVRVPPGDDVRDLFVGPQDGVRVREHDPDGVERDREEVQEEQEALG